MGTHRYYPKISRDGKNWTRLNSSDYEHNKKLNTARFKISLGTNPLWVSAQELITTSEMDDWISQLKKLKTVQHSIIGKSTGNRNIHKVVITAANHKIKKHIIILGRLHPPEVSGSLALMNFINVVTSDLTLAKRFLEKFSVTLIPMVNPDGVDLGHWRHNLNGVDLNRDWKTFNQKETRIVRDELLKLSLNKQEVVFGIDFHSTTQDTFYTLRKQLDPTQLAPRWINAIQSIKPNYKLKIQAVDETIKASMIWMYLTFNISTVTYEVGDETDRSELSKISEIAANSLMKLLLDQ